ncbi:MAG: Lrp/AsnC family transcriptional regulator [Rhizobacter sp.]|nr:Lrp/AsnC family transcriptional regulator [Rhizobacter sp.]
MKSPDRLPPGLDTRDALLIDRLHSDLPLSEHPFACVGAEFDMSEDEVLARLRRLLSQGVLTRFGPLYQIERAGGRFVLAALEVPESRYEEVTALVNALPEVAHNYRREHVFNMWFVVAAESAAQIDAALTRIKESTGLAVHAFPKEREYFVELRLPIRAEQGNADGTG